MKKKKLIIGIIVAVVVILGIFLVTHKSSDSKMDVEMGKVERGTITNSVTATGTIEAVTEVTVGTQVSGIIDKIYVDYNSTVKKGEVIALMDKVNLEAELRSSEAQLASSKSEYEYQLKTYNRNKALHEKKLISDSDYDQTTYNYQSAKAAYNQAQANIIKVRRNLGYATITSPIDGVVINRAVEEGQTVAAGFSTPTLFTIAADLTDMRVIANVDEADIGQVKEGQDVSFTVDAYPDDTFHGKVTQVRLEATTTSNVTTYEVVISAPNPDLKLKPGLTANVTIQTLERDNVLTVPSKALRFVPDETVLTPLGISIASHQEAPQGKKLVWFKNGNVLTSKAITVGEASNNHTEVLEGLNEGDQVVISITAIKADTSSNPFMPGPPGRNRNKKSTDSTATSTSSTSSTTTSSSKAK